MYHCGLRFYFAGQSCRVFEIIREMPPLERFTHEFSESGKLDGALAAEADVIFANLQDMDAETDVRGLFAGKSGETEVILLAAEGQMEMLVAAFPEAKDIWAVPMGDAQIRFRFLRWQQAYKVGKDLWYKDKDGIHRKVNDSFCRTVNKSREQVEGRGHAYIWDVEEDDPACIESEREVMEKRKTFVSEEVIRTGEGMRTLATYKSPLYDLDGSVMGTVGVAIDVTQERAYEQEIIEKNRSLEAIFMAMDCGVLCHTEDGSRILSINRAALRILGYESQKEMAGNGFDMISPSVLEEDREKLK